MKPDFFLSSTEGYGLEKPRACFCIKKLRGRTYDGYLLVKIVPPILGQQYGLGEKDIEYVVLATRHVGTSLFPVSEWPLCVHVARLLCDIENKTSLNAEKDLKVIAWAELYKDTNETGEKYKRNENWESNTPDTAKMVK